MDVQHLNIKLFVEDPEAVDLEAFLGVFNGWIQQQAGAQRVTEELLVDVADYRHVPAGPGVILIGHQANYSLDNSGNRLGLLYNRKALVNGTTQERLAQAARAALAAAHRLERENGLKFSGREIQLVVNDRLIAPNTPATFAALEPDLRAFFARLYGGATVAFAHHRDPRQRFTISVQAEADVDVATLLDNLETEPAHV